MSAVFSPCRKYRYRLSRYVGDGPRAVGFVMLNPSTADETVDDPTIRRCLGYAQRWGFHSLHIANLFAFRATDPKEVPWAGEPVGLDNDIHLEAVGRECEIIICAWGAHRAAKWRAPRVLRLLPPEKLRVLRFTKAPWHPLYLPGNLTPQPWVQP